MYSCWLSGISETKCDLIFKEWPKITLNSEHFAIREILKKTRNGKLFLTARAFFLESIPFDRDYAHRNDNDVL